MNRELMALRWLWLEKKCHYVLEQRSPRLFMGCPDVLGITKSRYLIEIEIKRSASDFHADFQKHHRRSFELGVGQRAKNTYYLMPRQLAEKLESRIPEWAGLMSNDESEMSCCVIKPAPNMDSNRLSLEECVRAVRLITNHSMTLKLKLSSVHQRFLERDDSGFTDWVRSENGTYSI